MVLLLNRWVARASMGSI